MDSMRDWDAWHNDYADPESLLSQRLRIVQGYVADWLGDTRPAPVTIVSSCAGDGRDLLEVLENRRDADRVTATLLEADTRNAERATSHINRAGLSGTEVRCVDAGFSDAYAGAVPADLVLLCGIFGNIDDGDIHRTISALPQFCNAGARVIWTRHRRSPDLTPQIREWFRDQDFHEEHFVAPEHTTFSVGVHRFRGDPLPLVADQHLFTFFR